MILVLLCVIAAILAALWWILVGIGVIGVYIARGARWCLKR